MSDRVVSDGPDFKDQMQGTILIMNAADNGGNLCDNDDGPVYKDQMKGTTLVVTQGNHCHISSSNKTNTKLGSAPVPNTSESNNNDKGSKHKINAYVAHKNLDPSGLYFVDQVSATQNDFSLEESNSLPGPSFKDQMRESTRYSDDNERCEISTGAIITTEQSNSQLNKEGVNKVGNNAFHEPAEKITEIHGRQNVLVTRRIPMEPVEARELHSNSNHAESYDQMQMPVEQSQMISNHRKSNNEELGTSSMKNKKRTASWATKPCIYVLCALVLLVIVTLGSVCGTGHCKPKSSPSVDNSDLQWLTDVTEVPRAESSSTVGPTVPKFRSFQSTEELYQAVDNYMLYQRQQQRQLIENDRNQTNIYSWVIERYGYPIGTWKVGKLTNFSFVFSGLYGHRTFFYDTTYEKPLTNTFNEDLSGWDVSNAVTMKGMFEEAELFHQDLDTWDVSNVENMWNMFHNCRSFDGNLTWNVSSLVLAGGMFDSALSFTGRGNGLSTWNTARMKDTRFMFWNAISFDTDELKYWDTGNVEDMSTMFYNASIFQGRGLENWDTSNVQDMTGLFYGAESFAGNISGWDTSKVTSMDEIFYNVKSFDTDLSSWNVSQVTSLQSAFEQCFGFTGRIGKGISTWDTSRVTNFAKAFYDAISFNGDLTTWNTSSALDMSQMFTYTTSFEGLGLSEWDTSSVTTMYSMFAVAPVFNQNLSNWRIENVNTLRNMFNSADSFTGDGVEFWDTWNVLDMSFAFAMAKSFDADLSNWQTGYVNSMVAMFTSATSFRGRGLSGWDTSNVVSMVQMFAGAQLFNSDLSSWNVSRVGEADLMFFNATSFNADLSSWDLSHVVSTVGMFALAESFNHSLCQWGETILPNTKMSDMFLISGCPITADPNEAYPTDGPFCHVCFE